MKIAEAIFYFLLEAAEDPNERHTAFAMVVPWPEPDQELLEWSSESLWNCPPLDNNIVAIIPVKWINAPVAMLPFSVDIMTDAALRERCRGTWYFVPTLGGASIFSPADAPNGDYDDEDDEDGDGT